MGHGLRVHCQHCCEGLHDLKQVQTHCNLLQSRSQHCRVAAHNGLLWLLKHHLRCQASGTPARGLPIVAPIARVAMPKSHVRQGMKIVFPHLELDCHGLSWTYYHNAMYVIQNNIIYTHTIHQKPQPPEEHPPHKLKWHGGGPRSAC